MKNSIFFQTSRITGIYFVLGVIWILVSDRIVLFIFSDLAAIAQIQTFKGWGYVTITAALLFYLVYKQMFLIDASKKSIEKRNMELKETNARLTKALTLVEQKEEILNQSLTEKEILLKEIHHRVKNNLQIISSLLNLQKNTIADANMQSIFMVSQQRIAAIALIHEKMYQSDNLSLINLGNYTKELVAEIQGLVNDADVHLVTSSDDILIEMDIAIPCGLIINELVTNALKYSINAQMKKIDVMSRKIKDTIVITVKDNGEISEDYESFNKNFGLGLTLVNNLIQQINGEISYTIDNGLEVQFSFSCN